MSKGEGSPSTPYRTAFSALLAYALGQGFFDRDPIKPRVIAWLGSLPPEPGVTVGDAIEQALVASSETNTSDAQDAARYRWLRDRNPNQLHLTRNEHASNYCTAKQWIEDLPDLFEDDPGLAREAMKNADTIWALQIYPDTPIGFNRMHRATLDELIDEAIKEGM